MGRPQRRLEPGDGPLAEFAVGLRDLRDTTGPMTYRRLAARAHYSATTLADAAGGERLPSLAVTLAYVEACGGDRAEWEARWRSVAAKLDGAAAADDAEAAGAGGAAAPEADPAGTGGAAQTETSPDGDAPPPGADAAPPADAHGPNGSTGTRGTPGTTGTPSTHVAPGTTGTPSTHVAPGTNGTTPGRGAPPAPHTAPDPGSPPPPLPLWRRAALPLTLAALAVAGTAGLTAWLAGPPSGAVGTPGTHTAPPADASAPAPARRTSGPDADRGPAPSAAATKAPAAHRYFAANDPVNRRNSRRLSPDSADLARTLLSHGGIHVAAGSAGMPVHRATGRTPTHRIAARDRHRGPNPFSGIDFPWDPSWTEPSGRGGWSVVVTPDGTSLECWRTVVRAGGVPSCEWGGVSDTDGSSVASWGTPTGSGLSRLAGTITREDWKSGRIRHALTFSLPFNGPRHVHPAVQSDGRGPDAWAEGQFIWLDPAYDIDADTSLRPYERMVAHALQDYGAFDVGFAETVDFTSERGAAPPGSGGGSHLSLQNVKFAQHLRVGTIRPE